MIINELQALIKKGFLYFITISFFTINVFENNDCFSQTEEDPTFIVVEVMPQFPGGDEARNKFLSENIVYPKQERDNGIQGLVVVSFVIEKDGTVSNPVILKGVTPGLDAETIRVVNLMPKWIPGTQRGKAVRVQINLPVRYSLEISGKKDKKDKKDDSKKVKD